MYDDDWWVNEQIEDRLHNLSKDESPPIHLYDWIQGAYPEIFKEWLSIYDIERQGV